MNLDCALTIRLSNPHVLGAPLSSILFEDIGAIEVSYYYYYLPVLLANIYLNGGKSLIYSFIILVSVNCKHLPSVGVFIT